MVVHPHLHPHHLGSVRHTVLAWAFAVACMGIALAAAISWLGSAPPVDSSTAGAAVVRPAGPTTATALGSPAERAAYNKAIADLAATGFEFGA